MLPRPWMPETEATKEHLVESHLARISPDFGVTSRPHQTDLS
jgi:hypothetical protein